MFGFTLQSVVALHHVSSQPEGYCIYVVQYLLSRPSVANISAGKPPGFALGSTVPQSACTQEQDATRNNWSANGGGEGPGP